jgi:hypothetical protein
MIMQLLKTLASEGKLVEAIEKQSEKRKTRTRKAK